MTHSAQQQEIVWLGMRFCVPAEWEIVRHSVKREKGRLALVDRSRQRLLLTWSECAKAPDESLVLSNYEAREREHAADCSIEPIVCAGWKGFRRETDAETLTRAVRYSPELQRWIEMTLSFPAGRFDFRLEEELLGSFSLETGSPRLRAFGLEIGAPEGWILHRAEVEAARTRITFRRGKAEAVVRRIGMLDTWFAGDLKQFLRDQIESEAGLFSASEDGKKICRVQSREPGRRVDALLGRLRDRRDLVWTVAEADALAQVTTLSSRKKPVEPEAFAVQVLPRTVLHTKRSERAADDEMLSSKPVRNRSVTAEASDKALVLRVPLQLRWYMRRPFAWLFPFSKERAVSLDAIGQDVWQACDGSKTVEHIVEAFAEKHRLSFQEARLSIMAFLRSLTQRGFVVMVGPREAKP